MLYTWSIVLVGNVWSAPSSQTEKVEAGAALRSAHNGMLCLCFCLIWLFVLGSLCIRTERRISAVCAGNNELLQIRQREKCMERWVALWSTWSVRRGERLGCEAALAITHQQNKAYLWVDVKRVWFLTFDPTVFRSLQKQASCEVWILGRIQFRDGFLCT